MLEFERTRDTALLRSIILEPRIWRQITDDYSPPPEEFVPTLNESLWYVTVHKDSTLLGFFMLHPDNAICWNLHTCLLPVAYGIAGSTLRAFFEWVWDHTECLRIVTNVPEYNRLAIALAKRAGMTEYGRNPESYMKNGKLSAQLLFGISREDLCRS